MKKLFLPIILVALMCALCVGAFAADTVYVNDGGSGSGESADAPLGSLADAINKVASGGTIVITDTLSITEPFTEPYHEGVITISGGKLVFNHKDRSRYFMSGPTTFEKMTITYGSNNGSKSGMILAQFNPVVMGEGITSSGFTLYVVGGYQDPKATQPTNLDSSVTINSGTYSTVIGFSRGNGTQTFTGTSNITINGGTVKNVYCASVNGSYSGNTNTTVNGGTVTTLYTGGDKTRRLNGDATVTINGGSVSALKINNVMGHTDIYYLGGKIETIDKSVAEDIQSLVTDGTASLIVRKGQIANQFIDAFDSATYEDGSKLSAAADVAVAQYEVIDKVPEKSTAHPAKVYVSSTGSGDGLSPDTAISDLAAAYQMLEGVDGTIVLIDEIAFDGGSYYEPEHSNHIVITSYDGERYFNGGMSFNNAKKINRYYFGGKTTIENTKITFNSSPLFLGRWNDITFGTGLEMEANKVYVVGGYQVPATDVPVKTGGTITVESGSYYCIIGYTRGNDPDGYTQFEGTQTINVRGTAQVHRIYGGPAQANAGDNVVINIDGGTVSDFIQVGGDQHYYSNNATVNMISGTVKKLDMHNVIGSTTVNWTGGEITEIIKSYGQQTEKATGNVVFEVAPLAANATYTLNYKNVTPTAEQLALFNTVGTNPVVGQTVVKMNIGKLTAYVNGVATTLDAAPVIKNDSTMLPIRFVADSLGATVGWDGTTSTVTVSTADKKIEIVIGAPTAKVNGVDVTLLSPAYIDPVTERTYLPVRFVSESLGATVGWDAPTQTVTLTK